MNVLQVLQYDIHLHFFNSISFLVVGYDKKMHAPRNYRHLKKIRLFNVRAERELVTLKLMAVRCTSTE